MMSARILDFYQWLREDKLSLLYQGVVNDDVTDKLINLSEENINQQKQLSKIRIKVSFIISECFQNIIRHQEVPEESSNDTGGKPSMFLVRNLYDSYYVASVNLIRNENVEHLDGRLMDLGQLNMEELREMYIRLLPDVSFSEKGGAGLGLIEMARKSGKGFQYEFVPVNAFFSLFFMQLHLASDAEIEKLQSIEKTKCLYDAMQQEQILLVLKGDFSQDSMLPILSMIENNLYRQAGKLLHLKMVIYVIVELFQNIMKHAATVHGKQEGVLILKQIGDKYEIGTGNLVKKAALGELDKHLKEINSLDKDHLKELYKVQLRSSTQSVKGGAGLGLIETARYSDKGFEYDFSSIDDEYCFFTLCTVV